MWRVWVRTVLVFQQAMWLAWTGCQEKSIVDKSGLPFLGCAQQDKLFAGAPQCFFVNDKTTSIFYSQILILSISQSSVKSQPQNLVRKVQPCLLQSKFIYQQFASAVAFVK